MADQEVKISYTADTSDLEKGVKRAQKATADLGKSSRETAKELDKQEKETRDVAKESKAAADAMKKTAAAGSALAAAVAVAAKATFELANAASVMVDDMNILSRRVGLSQETLLALGDAASRGGSGLEQMEAGLAAFVLRAGEAHRLGGASAKVFEDFGISIEDSSGNLRDMDAILADTLDAIGNLDSETEQAAAAAALFGARGSEIAAALGNSSEALTEGRIRTAELSAAFDNAQGASAEMDLAMQDLKIATDQATLAFGAGLTPEVAETISLMSQLIVTLAEASKEVAGITKAFGQFTGLGQIEEARKAAVTLASALEDDADAMAGFAAEIDAAGDELDTLSEVAEGVKAVRKEFKKADAEKAIREQEKALKDQAAAAEKLQDIIDKTSDPHKQIVQELEKQLELIDELEARTGDVQQADAARAAALRQFTEEQAALEAKAAEESEKAALEELDRMLEDLDQIREANQANIDARSNAERMALDQALSDLDERTMAERAHFDTRLGDFNHMFSERRRIELEAAVASGALSSAEAEAEIANIMRVQDARTAAFLAADQAIVILAAASQAAMDKRLANAEDLHRDLQRLEDEGMSEFRADINERTDLSREEKKQAIKAERERLREEKKVLRERIKAEKKAAREAFIANKIAALLQITVNTSVAITQAVAQLGPIAGAIAGVGIGILGAVQAGIVARQQPTFHQGGIVTADLLPGEAVLDRSTTERLGAEGIRDLQAGGDGGGGSSSRVSLQIGRLEAREIIRTDLRSGGQIVATVRANRQGGPEVGMSGLGVLS